MSHSTLQDVSIFDFSSYSRTDTRVWYQVKTDEIHNRLGHTATQVGSYLFVIGGHDSRSYTSEILTLNLGACGSLSSDAIMIESDLICTPSHSEPPVGSAQSVREEAARARLSPSVAARLAPLRSRRLRRQGDLRRPLPYRPRRLRLPPADHELRSRSERSVVCSRAGPPRPFAEQHC